ncbi:MAG: 16S rRNA (guanine(966)-N(2))-methyltransferase RsmD [Coriobacteriia bacterium]|nr:16S rRNA (guanine(966)-N(2))-methyltransferase RsmD [Coriobacteriia bacterium]MBS5479276.1 16S rRNA (guanine(966)-N(2))-methyltransferase RsmD [Coriobacteriia bacterium]
MRIVGGSWRGRAIAAPDGRDTRPTIDRVRESIASIVLSRTGSLDGASVLDAFGGSGAMGLEMLSRGAAHATMYDMDTKALACMRGNVEHLGVARERVSVVRGDVTQAASRGRVYGAPFDVVLLDPPYAMSAADVSSLMGALAERGMLNDGCVVIYERDAKGPELGVAGLHADGSKTYGTTAVDALVWDPSRPTADASGGEGEACDE